MRSLQYDILIFYFAMIFRRERIVCVPSSKWHCAKEMRILLQKIGCRQWSPTAYGTHTMRSLQYAILTSYFAMMIRRERIVCVPHSKWHCAKEMRILLQKNWLTTMASDSLRNAYNEFPTI